MAEFIPIPDNGMCVETEEKVVPKQKLPEVGDTMKIIVNSWGGFDILSDYTSLSITKGAKVIDVEVKSIKEAKVIYE